MRKFTKKQYLAAGAAAVIIAGGAGAAFAYWTTSGTGNGSATTGTASGITVNQTSTAISGGLTPGGAAQPLSGDFDNSNASAVKISQVNIAFDPSTVWQAGCSTADYSITQPSAQTGLVPAGTGVGSWSGGSIAMNYSASNQDGCKGQVVHLVYTTTTASGA